MKVMRIVMRQMGGNRRIGRPRWALSLVAGLVRSGALRGGTTQPVAG
jgi:hypothetical protein